MNQLKKQLGFVLPLVILIAVVLIVAGGVGYYFYKTSQEQEEAEVVKTEQVLDETAEWETYINTKYNYQLKVPKNFWNREIPRGWISKSDADFVTFKGVKKEEGKEISLAQLVEDINQEKVKEIVISGNDIYVTYQDETEVQSKKETETALSQSLINYGVEKEKLKKVEIESKEWQQSMTISHLSDDPAFNPPQNVDLISWVKKNFAWDNAEIPDKLNIEIDGISALKIYIPREEKLIWSVDEIYFIKDNKLFRIQMMDVGRKGAREFYDLFLSTFKFIE